MADILWLMPAKPYSENVRPVLAERIRAARIQQSRIHWDSLHFRAPGLIKQKGKTKQILDHKAAEKAKVELRRMIDLLKPKVIVVNDLAALWIIAGENYTLNLCRGSVYRFDGVPCVIIDDIKNMFVVREAKWVMLQDLNKIRRWADGQQRSEPRFTYRVCRNGSDLEEAAKLARLAIAIAVDIETKGGLITCIGYTYLLTDGRLETRVIPFYSPIQEDGCFWRTESEECDAWLAVKAINASPAIKVLQNGSYDCAYLIQYRVPLYNYLVDTSHLMHSIWMEAPKKLNFISSIMLDFCRYWKDENKGSKEDSWGTTQESLEQYWRYNALDTYNTILDAIRLIELLTSAQWAIDNYNTEFSLSVGPCLAMSMRGIRANLDRHTALVSEWNNEGYENLKRLRTMVDDPEFNPKAPMQVAQIIYDVLGAQKTRLQRKGGKYGERSTDEKVLDRIAEQPNPLFRIYIDAILDTKKPYANVSKYGDPYKMFRYGRFYSWLNPAGTETGRFNSGSSQFWVGTNGQNMPPEIREVLIADPDYVIFDIDYSASDDVFIAYESQDPEKIKLVTSSKDPHCFHASVFFKREYDEVLKGKKNNEDWCVHPTKGIRSNTKRVVHGRNFAMQGETMFNTMGREAVIHTAAALGIPNSGSLSDKELIGVCNLLCDIYDHPTKGLYKRIRPWQSEIIQQAVENGNRVTCAGGRTRFFFSNLKIDHQAQRQIAAYYGQGGTAANINRSINDIFYGKPDLQIPPLDDGVNLLLFLQVHDSLIGAVHKTKLHLLWEVQRIMEESQIIHGRTVKVKASPTVGLTWSKEMMTLKPETTYEDIVEFENKNFENKFKDVNFLDNIGELVL